MIELNQQQLQQIIRHCRASLPNEACGLLGGTESEGRAAVKKIYPLRNTDESPEHFSMDAREQFAAVADMHENGWKLLGNFHSHPSTPSRPSQEDVRLAFDPSLRYLILSLASPQNPVLNSFRIRGEAVWKEEIVILEPIGHE